MDQIVVRFVMSSRNETKETYSGPILMVPQTWIWVMGGLIVASSAIVDPFQSGSIWHDNPRRCTIRTQLSERSLQSELVGILLSNCVNQLVKFGDTEHWGRLNLFTVFTRSIALMGSERLNKYVGSEEMGHISIDSEKQFLHEIEDIREQLSMIKTVLFEQEEVWRDFAYSTWPDYWPAGPEGKFRPPSQPSLQNNFREEEKWNIIQRPQQQFPKFKRRLQKLDEDAERVQKSIELKLDLKARHASLKEARSASVVRAAVFGFTIITVIFTPLSFLVSLFALPIDVFQRNQNAFEGGATTVYSTQYIGTYMGESH